MNAFLWNIFLATVWAFAVGDFTVPNLVVGFVLGYAVLWLSQDLLYARSYVARLPRLAELAVYFLWEMVVANLRVAYDVMTPTRYMKPGVLAVPLDAKSDGAITLLANIITLTPGTLSLDVSPDRKTLYVHAMYVDVDAETAKRKLKQGFERRILELME